MSRLMRFREDKGFTLIELLVVMIIIGILAAVAIPIFMNQQKTSRDTATTSDLKNAITAVQTGLVKYPDATVFMFSPNEPGNDLSTTPGATSLLSGSVHNGTAWVSVGNSTTDFVTQKISLSTATGLWIGNNASTGGPGSFNMTAWNRNGKVYNGDNLGLAGEKTLKYSSSTGKIAK